MGLFDEIGKIGEFILDPLDIIDTGGIKRGVRDFTGRTAAEAAEQGADLMAQAGQQGIDITGQAVNRFQGGLSPFADVGLGAIGQVGRSFGQLDPTRPALGGLANRTGMAFGQLSGVNPFQDLTMRGQQLFGAGAGEAIMGDPVLQAMQNQISQQIMNQQAARGRAGAAETPGLLQQNLLANAQNFLSRERGDLLGALTAGENIAAGQRGQLLGATGFEQGLAQSQRGELLDLLGFGAGLQRDIGQAGLTGAAITSGLLGDIANAQAAGLTGAAGARGQGAQNVLGALTSIGSMFAGGG